MSHSSTITFGEHRTPVLLSFIFSLCLTQIQRNWIIYGANVIVNENNWSRAMEMKEQYIPVYVVYIHTTEINESFCFILGIVLRSVTIYL